jgi:hypothetical protein
MEPATIDFNAFISLDVLASIEDESCVLMIGSDLANFGDKIG